MNILLTRDFPGDAAKKLEKAFTQVRVLEMGRALTAEEFRSGAADADVIFCSTANRIDADLLAAAPRLRCIVTFSVGVDHVDQKALRERAIPLVHTPGILVDATADLAFALILAAARRLRSAQTFLEEGKFETLGPKSFLGLELRGSVLGIVGFGQIGQAVAKRGLAFGMQIKFVARHDASVPFAAERVDLAALLPAVDVLSLHCPLTKETRHLIGTAELRKMKANAVLVNTSRGPVVDELALVEHLRTNPAFFAGLDVYEKEPTLTPGLLSLPNVFCLPHIGSATARTRTAMADLCVSEAINFAQGRPLKSTVR